MKLFHDALNFAAKAHHHQFRKGTSIPYITHPVAVAHLLLEQQCGPEIVAAGLLHDTLEDTSTTYDELVIHFGETVANIVLGCSEKLKVIPWEERKQLKLNDLLNEDESVLFVTCADKVHNLFAIQQDLHDEGESMWRRFSRGKKEQEWYYKKMLTIFETKIPTFPLTETYRLLIDDVFHDE